MANCNRQKLLASIRYKKNLHPNKDDYTHPSWDRRESYAEKFDFGSELIDQIAKDAGYTNVKFIEKVKKCGYYNDIILKDGD